MVKVLNIYMQLAWKLLIPSFSCVKTDGRILFLLDEKLFHPTVAFSRSLYSV